MAQTNKTKYLDMAGLTLIVNGLRVAATKPGTLGNDLTGTEVSYLDGLTAGTVSASKAVVVDSNKDATGFRNISATGGPQWYSATAVPAGGTAGTGMKMSSTSNLGVFFGSGVPTLAAAQGSLYMRTDGSSTSTRLYVNSNGSTTWVAVTTAS